MVLYVARHGQSESNLQGRWGGRYDTSLTEKGREQARELAGNLPAVDFAVIVASSLTRTRQTAEIIQETLPLPVILSDAFMERNMGVYEGLTDQEIIDTYPDLWNRGSTRALDDAPTNGETYRAFYTRIAAALEDLKEKYPEQNVLLVTHGFVARVINWYCKQLSFEDMLGFTMKNCDTVTYTL